ncbi:MAG: MFS transporter [Actinobacteria bacterium]|nr:MFS transporter [Actinomycetota bacterium]
MTESIKQHPQATPAAIPSRWLTRNTWCIAGSAFFADLGYQAIIAGFPLLIVVVLHGTTREFALASALAYGGGALSGYIGGRLGDRYGRRRVALIGNLGIVLLALCGLAAAPWQAVALFVAGWWSRNFRSPPRRALLAAGTAPESRSRAFGFLHALDVGGGMLAALGLLGLLAAGVSLGHAFLFALAPLLASSVVLAGAREVHQPQPPDISEESPAVAEKSCEPAQPDQVQTSPAGEPGTREAEKVTRAVLIATALFGFSSYSIGFPVLTVAQGSHSLTQGVGAYAVFLGVSAATGWLIATRSWPAIATLAIAGYALSAVGTLGLGLMANFNQKTALEYVTIGLLGAALGVIETVEPSTIANLAKLARQGRAMGKLTAARGIGLLAGNLIMGLLYTLSPLAAYAYAAAVGLAAAVVLVPSAIKGRDPLSRPRPADQGS